MKNIKTYNNFINESITDLMKPKSEEEIDNLIDIKLYKILSEKDDFKDLSEEDKNNLKRIYKKDINDKINKEPGTINTVINNVVSSFPIILYKIKTKFNLKDGGYIEDSYSKSHSLIVDRSNIKQIYDYLESETHWGLNGTYNDIIKTWDMMEKYYPTVIVKLTIPSYSTDKTFDGRFKNYISFTFDVNIPNNPILVFNSNHVDSPYIWIRTSPYSTSTNKIDDFELLIKRKGI